MFPIKIIINKYGSTMKYKLLLTRQLIASSVSHPFLFVDALVSSSKVRLESSEQQVEWNVQTALSVLINTQIYLLDQFAAKNFKTHFIRILILLQKSEFQHVSIQWTQQCKGTNYWYIQQLRWVSEALCYIKVITKDYILYDSTYIKATRGCWGWKKDYLIIVIVWNQGKYTLEINSDKSEPRHFTVKTIHYLNHLSKYSSLLSNIIFLNRSLIKISLCVYQKRHFVSLWSFHHSPILKITL